MGFVFALILLLIAFRLADRAHAQFYDLYVPRIGGIPTRDELDAEARHDPIARIYGLFRCDRMTWQAVFTEVDDPELKLVRRRAEGATWILIGAVSSFFAIQDGIDTITARGAVPPLWPVYAAGVSLHT